ncbi:MAG: hypothetical protein IIW60_06985, partial [Alistipes sp.]|nr:hypothetical protein [Alistipes sp.]
CDDLLPLLGRDRWEFGKQLFFFGISHNCLEILDFNVCVCMFLVSVAICNKSRKDTILFIIKQSFL